MKTVVFQARKRNILAKCHACFDFHAHILDDFDFGSQDISRQSVGRDSDGHHTAGHGQFFKNRSLVPFPSQEIGSGQPCRTCPYDGYFFFSFFSDFRKIRIFVRQVLIRHESVEILDSYGFIQVSSRADPFAGMMAHATADGGKRVHFLEEFEALPVFPFLDERYEALYAHVGRTGGFARRSPAFTDGKSAGHSLWILLVGRPSFGKALIVLIFYLDRADLGAFPAARALGKIYISRFLQDPGLEIALFSFQFKEFRCGQKLYVQMPADLDQFW